MNITKYKKPELAILESKKKLRDYPEVELNTRINSLIVYLLNLIGIKEGKENHYKVLFDFIKTTARHYTFEEIHKAFQMYVNGELGEMPYQQLNAVVFGRVMKMYTDHKNQKLKNYRLQIPSQTELTEEEKKEIMEKAIENIRKEVKETGTISGISHHIYDYLDKQGKIKVSVEYKKSLYQKNKKKVLENLLSQKKSVTSRAEHTRISVEISKISTGEKNVEIINLCKRDILIEMYKIRN